MSEILEKKNLLCDSYKEVKNTTSGPSKFEYYRGFRISTLKQIVEYTFSGYAIKIEHNDRERRFDIFLSEKHHETLQEINLQEVDRFRKFYGKGFHVLILKQA